MSSLSLNSGKWKAKLPLKLLATGLQDLHLIQTTQTNLNQSPNSHYRVISRMTGNHLYLIVILKSLREEEQKPHLHNIQCIYRLVSLRLMCYLMPTYTYNDKFLLFLKRFYPFIHERQREAETQAEGEAGSMQGPSHGTRSRDSRTTPWVESGQ